MEDKNKPSDFCCFRCVIEQWPLTVIKLLRFFVLTFSLRDKNYIKAKYINTNLQKPCTFADLLAYSLLSAQFATGTQITFPPFGRGEGNLRPRRRLPSPLEGGR